MSSTESPATSHTLEIIYIPRVNITPDTNQIRKQFPEAHIASLKKDIHVNGLRQPLEVEIDEKNNGKYIIVEGECRFRATEEMLDTLPCFVLSHDVAEKRRLTANIMRQDLNPMEKSDAIMRILAQNKKLTKTGSPKRDSLKWFSEEYNLSQATVTELTRLRLLPSKIQKEQRETGLIPQRKLVKLATRKYINNSDEMTGEYDRLKKVYSPVVSEESTSTPNESTAKDNTSPKINLINKKRFDGLKVRVRGTIDYYSDIKIDNYTKDELRILEESLVQARTDIDGLLTKIDEQLKAVSEAFAKSDQEQKVTSETSIQNTSEPIN